MKSFADQSGTFPHISLLSSVLHVFIVGLLEGIIIVLVSIQRIVQLRGQLRLEGLGNVVGNVLLLRMHGDQILDDRRMGVASPRDMPPALAHLESKWCYQYFK